MSKFADYGIWHFLINCDIYVAAKSRFPTARGFLNEVIKDDDGFEYAIENSLNEAELYNTLFNFVSDNAYVSHRVGACPGDPDIDEWWTFVDGKGRGHIPVWTLDMREVREANKS